MDELDDDESSSLVSPKLAPNKFGYVHVFFAWDIFEFLHTKNHNGLGESTLKVNHFLSIKLMYNDHHNT
jgi:hypothetical protein